MAAPREARGALRLHLLSVVAGIVGLAVVASLVWLTSVVGAHTQQHLLNLQAGEASVVIGEVAPTIKTPLESAAGIVEASGGSAVKATTYVRSDVGTARGQEFDSFSVWRLGSGAPTRMLVLGRKPDTSGLGTFLASVPAPETLSVRNLLTQSPPSLGFAVESAGATPRYVVYAESPLPPNRRAALPASSAFRDLGFALYLGRREIPSQLIESTSTKVPRTGPVARVVVPLGTGKLDFVAWANQPLGGAVLPALPWIILGLGLVLVATGVVTTEWLVRRRRSAERIARQNRRLYTQQRSIAQKLQEALLPKRLPELEGMEFSSRYISGDPVADIGGDWYDVIRCDDRSFVFAVGDVSGRGVPAANTMAALHFAIRAYAAQGDDPPAILAKLSDLIDVGRDGHFATVLLGHVDVPSRTLTVANAGHLPPLVVSAEGAAFVDTATGAPIGVSTEVSYTTVTVQVPEGASVLAFTDGLVERRGEMLDTGLERLRLVTAGRGDDCRSLLDAAGSLASEGSGDDVAMLALRWIA